MRDRRFKLRARFPTVSINSVDFVLEKFPFSKEEQIILWIMIYLENLSNEEKKAIEELHTRIINDLPGTLLELLKEAALLYRYLKARDFDVNKAEKMLRKHIIWRKHFQIDTILEDFTPKPFFEKFSKPSDLGFDKKGNMIKYFPIGDLDVREMLKCVQINDYVKHILWHFEEITLQARTQNRKHLDKAVQMTAIFNADKLTLGNVTNKTTVEVSVRLLRVVQDNYPEGLNAIYVINTPGYYVFLFSILKAMMSSALLQKFHICGYSGWQAKLLDIIDADVLPAFLGGNRTDPDGNPLCNTFVRHGGRIHESYHLPEEERDFTNKSLVKRITIPSKQKKEIPIHVAETGSRIHWEFLIKYKDIGFGIFYKMSESRLKEILPVEKYDTLDGVEKGSYKTQSNGNYIIVFDNSYSWMNSKEVDYSITVLKSGS